MFTGIDTVSQYRGRQRGFSFTEIMFAVVILGIGFIMVAAVFPVALQQSKSTAEEINAAGIARGATHFAGQIFFDTSPAAGTTNLAATGKPVATSIWPVVTQIPHAYPTTAPAQSSWNLLRGNMVQTEDPRYAYVMLYRRDGDFADQSTWAPYAQIYTFPIQVRNKQSFSSDDTTIYDTGIYSSLPTSNLMAHPIRVSIAVDEAGVSLIGIDRSAGQPPTYLENTEAAVEGAFVVIADDQISSPTPAKNRGRMNGRIYRLGVRREDMDQSTAPIVNPDKLVFELVPGNDFVADPGADGVFGDPAILGDVRHQDDITAVGQACVAPSTVQVLRTADAFIVGRGYLNPLNPLLGFDGQAMPISAYTTFVKVK